ncbi:chemotaxis response regulator protein-glutamate methylesterase [Kineosporia sp. J2-2]|uniref:Protein-glutamate methylesterase/protein-glutamine glutaminase n=1 Tax=Kineosporia corallincola TaxID=2835133 RepID=A0ABS5TKL5_9ACTN|nr:chemotaxis response regulator protein-glutamate methylesterase [Kineosporia corallincola]MBT0771383.1 chemotaxis response regulator protein-glutamate methylesterase [Kineosporia corallincola]
MSATRIRVLIVDDSVVIRRLIKEILDSDSRIEVVGVAQNGQVALGKVEELKPDAITMDIEMPVMNGVDCVKALRKTHPRLPIVMFSTLTERGASATMDALAAGASDYVTKPANVGSVMESRQSIMDQLVPKLIALTGSRRLVSGAKKAALPPPQPVPAQAKGPGGAPARRTQPFGLLAIGSSTGGPDALATVLSALPGDLPVPVVITQHMPPVFTKMLAQRLDSTCRLSIHEAAEGDSVERGKVLIAPGGLHMELKTRGTGVSVHLSDAPPENFCRPAVDVMFRSVASVYRNRVLAVVLTGMGRDGAAGAGVIRTAGGEVFAQDEATSVVWGMPGATVMAGQADRVLPLEQMAATIASALTHSQNAAARQAGPVSGGVRA